MKIIKTVVSMNLALMAAVAVSAAESDAGIVKSAAKKLAAQDNYSWSSNSRPEGGVQGFRLTTEGKTEKNGLTQITIGFADRSAEIALKGDKILVKQAEEWKSPSQVEGRGAMARLFQNFQPPAAEAADLVEKVKELKPGEGGLYSGDFTEQGVKDLFGRYRRPGGPALDIKDAKGWAKFWVKDGMLTKYEYNARGNITFGQNQQERSIDQVTTVEIKDVGTTNLTLPPEVKKKLTTD